MKLDMLIRSFDPWSNALCTCTPKYSFCPYTGCSHGCLYCYITSYIPRGFHTRLKKNILSRLSKEVKKFDGKYISISNSSDPYPPEENKNKIMPEILKILKAHEIKVLLITKSDLVARDKDILRNMTTMVSISLTTFDERTTNMIEPCAPSPKKRLEALKKLSSVDIPCSLRLDPLIPGVNDEHINDIIEKTSPYIKHVVTSTVKPRGDGMNRLRRALPDIMNNLSFQRKGTSYYLPAPLRYKLLTKVKDACETMDLTFAACREGFGNIHTAPCDGSHLI